MGWSVGPEETGQKCPQQSYDVLERLMQAYLDDLSGHDGSHGWLRELSKKWQKLMHILHGNGPPRAFGKGRGGQWKGGKMKGKYRGRTEEEEEAETRRRAEEEEEAAEWASLQRRRPQLFADEWSVPVSSAEDLTRAGGVAMVYEAEIKQVLLRVVPTLRPTAILTTRPLHELGYKGYSSTSVTFNMQVFDETAMASDGMRGAWRDHLGARRYLTQLGDSGHVHRVLEAGLVQIAEHKTMVRIVVDIDRAAFEWAPDTVITAMHVTDVIKDCAGATVDMHEVVVREDGTATVRIPSSLVDGLLQKSGRQGAYFKPAFDEVEGLADFVLWLEPGLSHEEALDVCDVMSSIGLLRRGKKPMRYGLRWKTQEAYDAAVKMIPGRERLEGTTRCKVVPVTPEVGVQGIKNMLADFQWEVAELVYTDRDAAQGQALVYAKTAPPAARFQVKPSAGEPYQVYIRAVGRLSQQKMDAAGLHTGSRRDPRPAAPGTPEAKKRAQGALQRTQRAAAPPRSPQPAVRALTATGETPERQVAPRLEAPVAPPEQMAVDGGGGR